MDEKQDVEMEDRKFFSLKSDIVQLGSIGPLAKASLLNAQRGSACWRAPPMIISLIRVQLRIAATNPRGFRQYLVLRERRFSAGWTGQRGT